MQIGVIGLNHKQAPVEIREALAKVCTRRFGLTLPTHPFVLLTTCNRTEIYFSSSDLAETQSTILNILKEDLPSEIGQELYSFFGIDCFYHLAKVTSGFDSAILAETEIQGQVKSCYQQAHQMHSLPFELHYLFQKALKVGKEIRTKVRMPKLIVDIEHAVMHFGKECKDNPKILFIGASRTNLKIARFLNKKGYSDITLANRTNEKSMKLCKEEGYRFLPWSSKKLWTQFNWVVAATKSDQYHLFRSDLGSRYETELLIDLAVPRNIDPQLGDKLPLVNIDQVNALLHQYSALLLEKQSEIEDLLNENAKRYTALFHQKSEKLYLFA